MNFVRTPTENPIVDQWRLLGQYAYPNNIRRYLESEGHADTGKSVDEFIAGCVRQGEAYFNAAERSPLDIAPLLVYYGTSNLLAGASAMLTGVVPPVKNHGMRLQAPKAEKSRIADVSILPFDPQFGALQHFCNVFSGGCPVAAHGLWSVEEVLGSVPDLRRDFENCYEGALPYTIPVELAVRIVNYRTEKGEKKRITFERINTQDMARFGNPVETICSVKGFQDAYLFPQESKGQRPIILHRKRKAEEIGFYSIYGQKFLELPHLKNGQRLSPHQLIIMYMGLFALGYISRYHPELWNPFVRSDTTGERLVIEKFLALCQRYVPNLVLNLISKARIEFVHPTGTGNKLEEISDE